MRDVDVVVVGAGVAGLRAAQVLARARRDVVVLERAERVGGRVQSREVDGFVLDEGFQLINPAYPELAASGVLPRLDLRCFDATLRFVSDDGAVHDLADPRRHPARALRALSHPDLGLRDVVALARLVRRITSTSTSDLLAGAEGSAREALAAAGIGPRVIEGVLTPFLRGTLLDDDLVTPWSYVALVIKSFLGAVPGTPARGARALPEALSADLPGMVHLGETALEVRAGEVVSDRERYRARRVIVATDADAAARLVGTTPPPWRAQTTWWWRAPRLEDSAQLRLTTTRGLLASTLDLASVAPERAPAGSSLIAAAAVGVVDAGHEREVGDVVARLYGLGRGDLDLVERQVIARALPGTAHATATGPGRMGGVLLAGDYLTTPSLQGALVSGRRAGVAARDAQ